LAKELTGGPPFSQFCVHSIDKGCLLRCALGSFWLGIFLGRSPLSLFDMLLTIRKCEGVWARGGGAAGFENLMFPLWFALLGDSFVFKNMSPFILFLVFSLFLFGALVYL